VRRRENLQRNLFNPKDAGNLGDGTRRLADPHALLCQRARSVVWLNLERGAIPLGETCAGLIKAFSRPAG